MIDRVYRKWYNNCRWLKCERAGTGRQARLRGVCLWRTGSSPVARTKKGWRNRCHPDFFQYSCGFPGFSGPIFQNRPTVDVQPQKEQKQQKPPSCYCSGRRFFHFLDTGREMIFDGPTGLSWELTREGDNRLWPGAVPPLARGEGKISKCFYIS